MFFSIFCSCKNNSNSRVGSALHRHKYVWTTRMGCTKAVVVWCSVFGCCFFALQIHAPMFEKVGFICKNAPKNGRIKT